MHDEIADKIRKILIVPAQRDCEVVYLLVEIRKYLELSRKAHQFPWLMLMCNWAVHPIISRRSDAVEQLLTNFDQMAERISKGDGFTLEFLDFLSLADFKKDLKRLLESLSDCSTSVVTDCEQWNAFLDLYTSVICECPIRYEASRNLKVLQTLTVNKKYDSGVLDLDRPRLWMVWIVDTKGGIRYEWPFFN